MICCRASWSGERMPASRWITVGFENGVCIVAANRWGREKGMQFTGGSCIIDPSGRVQDWFSGGKGVVYGQVDLSEARDKRFAPHSTEDRMLDRRCEEYSIIGLNTYLWDPVKFCELGGGPSLSHQARDQ